MFIQKNRKKTKHFYKYMLKYYIIDFQWLKRRFSFMNEKEKINILEKNLKVKYKNVNDYDYHQIATEYVQRGGWNENKEWPQVLEDVREFLLHKLETKNNR